MKRRRRNSGFEKLLKFKKGKFFISDTEVPLGRQYVAHATQWTKCWVKFADKKVVDRRIGKVADGYVPPARNDLGDVDEDAWETSPDGKKRDPWSLQYLLPIEDTENGEVAIFTTSTAGGRRAVADLCKSYARHCKKRQRRGLPIVRLATTDMPTKAFGPVPRPDFEIVDWDEAAAGGVEVTAPDGEPNDEIPF